MDEMDDVRSKIKALPQWVRVLCCAFLVIIGPPGWLIGLALIVFLNWK